MRMTLPTRTFSTWSLPPNTNPTDTDPWPRAPFSFFPSFEHKSKWSKRVNFTYGLHTYKSWLLWQLELITLLFEFKFLSSLFQCLQKILNCLLFAWNKHRNVILVKLLFWLKFQLILLICFKFVTPGSFAFVSFLGNWLLWCGRDFFMVIFFTVTLDFWPWTLPKVVKTVKFAS